jgi:hypothetical protein
MYLKRFTRDDRVAVYDRVTGKLRRDKIRSVAAIKDFYVVTSATGERDETIESTFLGRIESDASPIIDKLCALQPITDTEHGVMAVFVALLCTRLPSFDESLADMKQDLARVIFRRLAGTPALAADFLERRRRLRQFSPEEFSSFVNSNALIIPPDQNERVRLMIEMAEPGVAAFDDMDWCLAYTDGENRFITSDGPMGMIPTSGALPTYGELSPNVLKFLALSANVCLRLSDRREAFSCLTTHLCTGPEIAEINAAIARAAVRLLIGQEEAHIENVLNQTKLEDSPVSPPRTVLVEWYDEAGHQSFMLSVRTHSDTVFPLYLPIAWECKSCGSSDVATFGVGETLQPLEPRRFTDWLDERCRLCGVKPRENQSTLSGKGPLNLVPPIDS